MTVTGNYYVPIYLFPSMDFFLILSTSGTFHYFLSYSTFTGSYLNILVVTILLV